MQENLDIDRLTILSIKYVTGFITAEEQTELDAFLSIPGNRDRFNEIVSKERFEKELPYWEEAAAREEGSLKAISKGIQQAGKRAAVIQFRRWGFVAAGAASLVLCYFGYMGLKERRHSTNIARGNSIELMPGGQKAILVLAGGRKIVLDDAKEGQVVVDNGAKIEKVSGGVLSYSAYSPEGPQASKEVSYNTLTVPNGGTYEIILPDHSTVYLNSGSSLRYAVAFDHLKSRTVELTGEAYFDIKPDPVRPFEVRVNDKTIAVLGTRFDVNAYDNEPSLDATLLAGSIRVSNAQETLLLRPGQQAQFNKDGLRLAKVVDTATVVAWKMGDFRFNNAPIGEVMRQLERWYNVKVQFVAGQELAETDGYTGVISRNLPASEVLKALEASGYHFKIVSKDRIEVSP
jgi:transmembrane sensor